MFIVNSSFLLLFLKDIKRPNILLKIADQLPLVTTQQVLEEVDNILSKKGLDNMKRYIHLTMEQIFDAENPRVYVNNPIVIHRPFMGYGEYSVVLVFWYLWYRCNVHDLYIITDDKDARRYIVKYIRSVPQDRLLWSLKFLDKFVVNKNIIDKDMFLILLDLIEASDFHIDKNILDYYRNKYKR